MERKLIASATRRSSENIFPRAASLTLFAEQGAEFRDNPITAELFFGDENVIEEDVGFNISFRKAILSLELDRAEILRSPTRLERRLETDQFTQVLKRVIEDQQKAEKLASGSIYFSLSNILRALGVNLRASGLVGKNETDDEIKILEGKSIYSIVQPIGADSWQIGHELIGDPTKIDGTLIGEYLTAGEDKGALCHVTPSGKARTYEITLKLRVSFRDCVYRPLGKDAPTGSKWPERNKLAIERAMQLKAIRDAQVDAGLSPEDGEFIIAQSSHKVVIKR